MADPMQTPTIERALRRLGDLVDYHTDVEILLVGGAAGMLTGVLPASRTTGDCDVMSYVPEAAMPAVERAAERVAGELGLSPRWLNSDVLLRRDGLPDGWERRRIPIGRYGRLVVWAVSRPDLIAMKVLAGRAQDLDDLTTIRVRVDEADFVRRYIDRLSEKRTSSEQIDDARAVLDSLDLHEHE